MDLNSLSWVIYLADIVSGVSTFLGFAAFFLGLGGLLAIAITWVAWFDQNTIKVSIPLKLPILTTLGSIFIVCGLALTAILIPSKQAVLAIAASEAGEMVVTHPKSQKLFNDLTALLEQELEEALSDE